MDPLQVITTLVLVAGFVTVSSGLAASLGMGGQLPRAVRRLIGLDEPLARSSLQVVSWLGFVVFGALTGGAVFVELKDVASGPPSRMVLALFALALDVGWIAYLCIRRSRSGS
ncbi:MAG: hypothetical protein M3077_11415 [Candidatus Dormibacteraeota bacterium]|nr:hypothetical protein [Candidatus Dormibacteraeota bacterium]